jgi:hypothetical protein
VDIGFVTAPTPADLPEVRQTTTRLFKWLAARGINQGKLPLELFYHAIQADGLRGRPEMRAIRPQTAPFIVEEAFLTSFAAVSAMRVESRMRALAEVHELRSRVARLTRTLGDVDKELAKHKVRVAEPTFSKCGNDIVAALEVAADQLETISGINAPTTKAKWKAFVDQTTAALLSAGTPLDETLSLFRQDGELKTIKARLNRRKARGAARVAAEHTPRKKS